MAATITAISGDKVDPSGYRVNRAGFVIRSAVQMARHQATYR